MTIDSFSEIKVRKYGSTGVLTGMNSGKTSSGAAEQDRFTQTWTWKGGHWLLAASHVSKSLPICFASDQVERLDAVLVRRFLFIKSALKSSPTLEGRRIVLWASIRGRCPGLFLFRSFGAYPPANADGTDGTRAHAGGTNIMDQLA